MAVISSQATNPNAEIWKMSSLVLLPKNLCLMNLLVPKREAKKKLPCHSCRSADWFA